jgi:hypothetical protein
MSFSRGAKSGASWIVVYLRGGGDSIYRSSGMNGIIDGGIDYLIKHDRKTKIAVKQTTAAKSLGLRLISTPSFMDRRELQKENGVLLGSVDFAQVLRYSSVRFETAIRSVVRYHYIS